MEAAINPNRRGFSRSKIVKYLHQVAKPSSLLPQYGGSRVKTRPSSASKIDNVSTPLPLVLDSLGDTTVRSHGSAAEENIDAKATTYIMCVRERFEL